MGLKRTVFYACLAVAGTLLVVSFYVSHQGRLALASLLPVGAMLYARRSPGILWTHISLAGFALFAAVGAVSNIPLMPMALVMVTALVSWDMALEMRTRIPTTTSYDSQHYKYLAIALGLGLAGSAIGQLIHARLPFVIMLGLGIFILVWMNQLIGYYLKSRDSKR